MDQSELQTNLKDDINNMAVSPIDHERVCEFNIKILTDTLKKVVKNILGGKDVLMSIKTDGVYAT